MFSTKSNPTTRENIANVYGAKTLPALIPLDLELVMGSSTGTTQSLRKGHSTARSTQKKVQVQGHISRPFFGEGRQTPDRQMFFVNSRPCGLPQVAKAINEVYKSYNITQSPFIFANLVMDTNDYDVNVSPDKRTILLHDQNEMLESLKLRLSELFEAQDPRLPQGQLASRKQSLFQPINTYAHATARSIADKPSATNEEAETNSPSAQSEEGPNSSVEATQWIEGSHDTEGIVHKFGARNTPLGSKNGSSPPGYDKPPQEKPKVAKRMANSGFRFFSMAEATNPLLNEEAEKPEIAASRRVRDSNHRSAEYRVQSLGKSSPGFGDESRSSQSGEEEVMSIGPTVRRSSPGVVQHAFDCIRPKRTLSSLATITIGDTTTVTMLGPSTPKRRKIDPLIHKPGKDAATLMGKTLRAFVRPGSNGGDTDGGTNSVSNSDASDDDAPASAKDAPSPGASRQSSEGDDSQSSELNDNDANNEVSAPSDRSTQWPNLDQQSHGEAENRAREEARIARIIEHAERTGGKSSVDNTKRATAVLRGGGKREPTLELIQRCDTSVARIERSLSRLISELRSCTQGATPVDSDEDKPATAATAEERLSLTVSKKDFANMHVVGQFNLGFILAIRPHTSADTSTGSGSDELFIIDQHASDEKYNFERLQAETVVQNQRLVQPRVLDLTAIEEEIILSHPEALSRNGFIIDVDISGDAPVGRRCSLVSLPMSREVVFGVRDLEELLALLGEQSGPGIPRPSKVRRMFAMRACRSSIMVGKTLTEKQMERVVRNMGEIDKPWNCPHGRPTMRHLFSLDRWVPWDEDRVWGVDGDGVRRTDWAAYLGGG